MQTSNHFIGVIVITAAALPSSTLIVLVVA